MTRTLLVLPVLLFGGDVSCQPQAVSTRKIDQLWLKELFRIDSSGNKNKFCSIDLAHTTYDKANMNRDGHFDVTFVVDPGLSLFFFHPSFFVREYELQIVVNNLN